MKKKVLSLGIITILVMMLVLLTGCGNTENTSSNTDNSKSNKEESIKDSSIYGTWVDENEKNSSMDNVWVFDENEVYWSNNWYESYGTYTIKPNNKIQITLNKNGDFDGRNTEYTYTVSDGKMSLIPDDDSAKYDNLVKKDTIKLDWHIYKGSGSDMDTHKIEINTDGTCHVKVSNEKYNIDSDGTYTYTPKGKKIEITLNSGEVLNCVMDSFGINWTDENYLFYE